MAWVVGGTFLVLVAGFRSLLVALKAIILNLLSVGAALGLLVVVFQNGHGSRMFGLATGTGGVFPIVPILTFAIVFGLSMDYEVFLVARVREARQEGRDERDAIAEGLARTGGVITSAAVIMIAVFAAFTMGDFVLIKVLGFGLAVAVLLDATIMRLALSPASDQIRAHDLAAALPQWAAIDGDTAILPAPIPGVQRVLLWPVADKSLRLTSSECSNAGGSRHATQHSRRCNG